MKRAIYAMLCVVTVVCVFSAILIAAMKLIIGVIVFLTAAAMI